MTAGEGFAFDTPDQSRALALLAARDPELFDTTVAAKGWAGITDEERDWAARAFEDKYKRKMEEPYPSDGGPPPATPAPYPMDEVDMAVPPAGW